MADQLDITPTSTASIKQRGIFFFKVNDELTVSIRKPDMMRMLLTGIFPLPLLAAADRFQELQQEIALGKIAPDQIFNSLTTEERDRFLEFLEVYVCKAVVQPQFTRNPDIEPHKADITILEVFEMMSIWNAEPPATEKEDQPLKMTREEAASFRPDEQRADGPAGSPRTEVRENAQFLDLGDREAVFG